jgi:3-oxoacyl-[acyl-carrier protein] reductase
LLITGARKGIGRGLVEYYLGRGFRVFGCSREASDLAADRYQHIIADVGDEGSVKHMMSAIRTACGRLDFLLNNAGIASMNHFMLTPATTLERVLKTNVEGTFLVTREAARLMQKRKFGRVVNFTSVAVPLKLEGESVYAASKAAVISLTEVLARELGPLGITVNAIGPTPVRTDLIRGIPEKKMDALIARQAIARYGEIDDIANVVDFFLSPRSGFVTGQVVYLGGVS